MVLVWTWDPNKAAANLKKHGVSFELAVRVFNDPHHLILPDPYSDETRWRTLGAPFSERPLVLFVVHTDEDDGRVGRIISARRATSHERRAYEDAKF